MRVVAGIPERIARANGLMTSSACPPSSATLYYGYAWRKGVIANIYPAGTTAQFGYIETNFHF